MDSVRFADGRCYVGESVNLEAPLEAFGQCKLVSAFGELHREQVLATSRFLGLETIDGMPYDELRWTASSILQHLWFEQIPGGVPKSVKQNYEERMAHYQSVLERVKRGEVMTGEQVAEGGTATTKKARAPKAEKPNVTYTYSLSSNTLSERIAKGIANEQTTNHDFIIVAILQKDNKPVTLEHLTTQVENTGRYETKDPLPKSIRWHLNKMEKEGVVIAHEHAAHAAPKPAEAPKAENPNKPPAVQGTKSAKAAPKAAPKAAQATAKA